MGNLLFLAAALFLVFKIYKASGVNKLTWFFSGILLFPEAIVIVPKPQMTFPRFIVYALLIVTIVQYRKKVWDMFLKFPLKASLILLFFSLLIIGLADGRIEPFLRVYRPVNYFIENFLVLFLTFFYVSTIKDALYIYNFLMKLFFFFGVYGILNLVTQHNEYYSFIVDTYGGFDSANLNMGGRDRFRISSFFGNPIVYGFLLSTILLLQVLVFKVVKLSPRLQKRYILIFCLLIVNLLLVNSRTPLLAFGIGFTIFTLFAFDLTQKFKIIFIGILMSLVAMTAFPKMFSIVENTIGLVTGQNTDNVGGSSVEMREVQLAASFTIFAQSPIFGNGFSYINEGLGFSNKADMRISDEDFYGFESYAFKLLIEQGIIGIVANVIFFISIFLWLIRQRKHVNFFGMRVLIMSVALLLSFILFILGTGDLGTFLFFLSVTGINLKVILLDRKAESNNQFNIT